MIIEFEDNGQDFTQWELDAVGKVIECKPFQGWLWEGGTVRNMADLEPGGVVYYQAKGGSVFNLVHKVEAVRP